MPRDKKLQTMSVNLPSELIWRIRVLGFNEELSASSIVEQALLCFLDGHTDETLAKTLREGGASLRRA